MPMNGQQLQILRLLAQGKRVLVTAHTDRALKEVRAKPLGEIRPLAVSVVGSSREDMGELRTSVERIGGPRSLTGSRQRRSVPLTSEDGRARQDSNLQPLDP